MVMVAAELMETWYMLCVLRQGILDLNVLLDLVLQPLMAPLAPHLLPLLGVFPASRLWQFGVLSVDNLERWACD